MQLVTLRNGRRVMWVNRPYPMSTLANAEDPLRLFDVRLFAARVVGAVFDQAEVGLYKSSSVDP